MSEGAVCDHCGKQDLRGIKITFDKPLRVREPNGGWTPLTSVVFFCPTCIAECRDGAPEWAWTEPTWPPQRPAEAAVLK